MLTLQVCKSASLQVCSLQVSRTVEQRGMFYVVKIGTKLEQSLSEIEFGTFARIKKVIWDQLLVTKAEIIKGKLCFLLRVKI